MSQEFTSQNFQSEVLESTVPVLVDFFTPNCGPCRMIAPIIDELANEGGSRYQVGKINAWEQSELATNYQISAVPTLLLFHEGKVVNKLVGYHDKPALLKALRQIEELVSQ
jgi:thioredoxin 1